MAKVLFNSLVSVFGLRKLTSDAELEKWARAEYGRNWQFAYHHMRNKGKPPIIGVDY